MNIEKFESNHGLMKKELKSMEKAGVQEEFKRVNPRVVNGSVMS